VMIASGNGFGTNGGGETDIFGGISHGSAQGGMVLIEAGSSVSGNGGIAELDGGSGNNTTGTGGALNLFAGGGHNGGNVNISGGNASGSPATPGNIILTPGSGGSGGSSVQVMGNLSATGAVTAGSFSGNGSGLSNVAASSVNFSSASLTGLVPITNLPVGTVASTVAAGNDPRLSDPRAASSVNFSSAALSGTVPVGNLPSTVATTTNTNNFTAAQTIIASVPGSYVEYVKNTSPSAGNSGLAAEASGNGSPALALYNSATVPSGALIVGYSGSATGTPISNFVVDNGGNLMTTGTITATAHNYAFAYDTTAQGITSANTYQDILFGTNGQNSGFAHTAGASTFTVPAAGMYLVNYTISLNWTSASAVNVTVQGLVNGTAIAGTQNALTLNTASFVYTLSGSFIAQTTSATDTIKLQIRGSGTNAGLINTPGNSAAITITKIQ